MADMADKMTNGEETILREGERLDDTGFHGYRLIQKPEEFCYGVDAVLLADFAARNVGPEDGICDLGTGTGIVPLILAHKTESRRIVGVEIQRDSWDRACRMTALNGLEDRLTFLWGDVADIAAPERSPEGLVPGSFRLVTSNPPYMAGPSGLKSENEAKRIARHETTAGLREFAAAAARLLDDRGEFCLVHRPSRLADILESCRAVRLEPKELRLVAPRLEQKPNILLLRCRKNGGAELKVLPTLAVYGDDGRYSREIMEIYERISPGSRD